MSIFSERLKQSRLESGLTQKQVCDKTELKLRQLGRYENAEQEPTISKVINLADTLNISIDYLAGRTDDPRINK